MLEGPLLRPKQRLAEAAAEILRKKDIDAITVTEITAVCQMPRQVFYHYFKDKYELVNWMYRQEFVEKLFADKSITPDNELLFLLRFIENNRKNLMHIWNSKDVNGLSVQMYEDHKKLVIAKIQYCTKKELMEEQLFLAEVYCDMVSTQIKKHMLCEKPWSSEKIYRMLILARPEKLNALFGNTVLPYSLFDILKD